MAANPGVAHAYPECMIYNVNSDEFSKCEANHAKVNLDCPDNSDKIYNQVTQQMQCVPRNPCGAAHTFYFPDTKCPDGQ